MPAQECPNLFLRAPDVGPFLQRERPHQRRGDRAVTAEELFKPGEIRSTPDALQLMKRLRIEPGELLRRHVRGDWGDIPPESAAEYDPRLREGFRILSSYRTDGKWWRRLFHRRRRTIWVITEPDRSVTTFLLPTDYWPMWARTLASCLDSATGDAATIEDRDAARRTLSQFYGEDQHWATVRGSSARTAVRAILSPRSKAAESAPSENQ
jgi:hypothetical protein